MQLDSDAIAAKVFQFLVNDCCQTLLSLQLPRLVIMIIAGICHCKLEAIVVIRH